ncbi:hypothetical protein V2G26_010775 [Clonostachys chloroleuca]
MLENTEDRDQDQVVEKYSRKKNWTGHRVLMVDQLWLWILNNNTVLSCFPGTWPDVSNSDEDREDVFLSLVRHIRNKGRWVRTAEQLAYFMVDRCAANVYDPDLFLEEQLDFMGMFQHSIADIARIRLLIWYLAGHGSMSLPKMIAQNSCYKNIPSSMRLSEEEAIELFKANDEFRLLEQVKDVLDELRMIHDIHQKQMTVMRKFSSLDWRGKTVVESEAKMRKQKVYLLEKRPKERQQTLDDLHEKSKAAYNSIIHLIEIKQTRENLYQAMSTHKILNSSRDLLQSIDKLTLSNATIQNSMHRIMEQSETSGKTIMTFTVVTVLFLPLSTIAGFFSINARELKRRQPVNRRRVRLSLSSTFSVCRHYLSCAGF